MAKYTTELLSIVYAYSDTGKTLTERINQANQQYIFAFPFPIWDDAYKITLERKIVMHYLRREIAQETVEMWRTYLEMKMNEVMPYYIDLYHTKLNEFNLDGDINLTEVLGRVLDSTASEDGTAKAVTQQGGTTKSDTLTSRYPQAAVNGEKNLYYADGAQNSNGETTLDGTDTTTTQRSRIGVDREDTTKTRKGYSGIHLQGDIIMSIRKTLINIDQQIISDLQGLFMTLY